MVMVMNGLSESAENYLKAIYRLSRNNEFIKPKVLMDVLPYASSTITIILQRLASKGYVEYRKYRGVRLTEKGKIHAAKILRAHRVFEVFLYQKLLMDIIDIHVEACKAEHALSTRVVDKLYEFLDKPKRCPHGNPIPTEDLETPKLNDTPLARAEKGMYVVTRISYETVDILRIAKNLGMIPGKRIRIIHLDPKHNVVILDVDGRSQTVPLSIARVINVVKIEE